MIRKSKNWFNGAVAYQIYPRSFYDSDGDGVGDLKGIIKKLDYLAGKEDSLGVDVIWLSPFYKSPMADFGYDISDYYSVDPIFGDIDDFRELIKQAHGRGIKVLIDLVVNHTADKHPWFIDSKSSKTSRMRDWYVWHDGKDGAEPNDWLSLFGGSAWQYDKSTHQYYLHSFSPQQPDLNWANKEVRQAVKDIMRFWLDLGVDGFRVDAVYWLSKDHRFRNDPPNLHRDMWESDHPYDRLTHTYSRKGPELYEYLREITDVLKKYDDRFMVIEAFPEGAKKAEQYSKFYRYVNHKLLAPFNFDGMYYPWSAPEFKSFIDEFQADLKKNYLPVYTFGNHDKPRLATRIGQEAAPAAAVLLLTLPGMPFIYYGEELGMSDAPIPKSMRHDPLSQSGEDRDKERTPMQWNDSIHAGFSRAKPWLPVPADYRQVNVAAQTNDHQSILSFYRKLIKLRHARKSLTKGNYQALELNSHSVYGLIRQSGREKTMILINFTNKAEPIQNKRLKGKIILSTYPDSEGPIAANSITLRPNEGLIIALS